ncbi:MAG TPA: type 4a pilus biogenesis protein PilO [Candidatus Rifleibacterium sp.]|nr:type 4a pilus biogenesis protein PilO [Candidatus Rifleibacterium sp.]
MNPNELKKLKERAPLPLLILVILFFLPSLLVEPQNEALKAAAESCHAAVKAAKTAVRNRETCKVQIDKLQRLQKIHADVSALLPEESQLPGIIERLQKIAITSNVSLEEVRYEFTTEFDKLPVPSYSLKMNLKSDYASMRTFLSTIENLDSPVIIQEIVLVEGGRYAMTVRLLVK